jgi:hypothetical protein
MRTVCSFLFALSLAASAQAQSVIAAGGDPTDPHLCDTERSEPVVLWDLTGWTWLGEVHANLVVHNSGIASVANATGDVRTVFLDKDVALGLRDDLAGAGVATLCDQAFVSDSALTTVTILGDGATTRAHTVSYWVAEREYGRVQATIDAFLATHFPGFTVR